jgi:hypothetical protein
MSKKISEYTFSHGLHRGANGSYIQLSKELLGRALTHEEMNYNLALTGEIIKNYEILGHGDQGIIDPNIDLGKTPVLSSRQTVNGTEYYWDLSEATGGGGGGGAQGAQGAVGATGASRCSR